jgi:hypothetical protein
MKNTFLAQSFIFGLTSLIFTMPALAEQACVRIQNGKLICGELENKKNDGNSKPLDRKVATQSKMGLAFTLEGCKKAKAGLYCSISVYNSIDFDKKLSWTVWPHNVLIDSESRQYTTAIVKMGNVRDHQNAILPPKATIKSQVFFRPSNGLSNYIRVLTIAPIIEGDNGIRLTFRDFNVSQ